MEQQTAFSHMKVNFDDTIENWHRWGQLVEFWVSSDPKTEKPPAGQKSPEHKPTDVAELVNRMEAHGITGAGVYGPSNPNRKVKFLSYEEDGPLVIMLPTKDMLAEGKATVHDGQPYPLPVFYKEMFDCEPKALKGNGQYLATCRVGEYTINECC